MAERALLLAKLLAGEMPSEIEEVFERCSLSLFPASRRTLVTDCSWPDWENPCKHLAAAFYILAERFDADPFLIFAWRGRTKEELIQRLRVRRARPKIRKGGDGAATTRAAPPLSECLGTFWDMAADISDLHISPRAVATPAGPTRRWPRGARSEPGRVKAARPGSLRARLSASSSSSKRSERTG